MPPLLFAYANEDDAVPVVHEANTSVSSADLNRVINRLTAAFAKQFSRSNPVPIKKVRAFSNLPHAILASAAVQGIQPTAARIAYDEAAHI